jgi:hypothetical protein
MGLQVIFRKDFTTTKVGRQLLANFITLINTFSLNMLESRDQKMFDEELDQTGHYSIIKGS